MLKIKQLTKTYGEKEVVNSLNLEIKKGEIFGFIGPNGAGKTTTMKMIVGLVEPTSGRIEIEGKDLLKERIYLNKKIGYMPDFFGIYNNLKVLEYMEFYASLYGIYGVEAKKRMRELLELVNLGEKENQYVDHLSRGMKQRLCLARSLVHDPSLVVLDEPASGLDPMARLELQEVIKNLKYMNKTVILSSHILQELSKICTTMGIMKEGKMLLSGKIEDIIEHSKERSLLKIVIYEGREKALELLKKQKQVESISIENECFRIKFCGDRQSEAFLLKQLIEEGVLVSSFVNEQYNIEDIFIQTTQKGEKMDENESNFI